MMGPMSRQPAGGAFLHSALPEPHRARTKAILEKHPDIRHHIGHNPRSFGLILALVAAQMMLAFLLRSSPWWLILAAAALIGAFANHALWVLIHECTHNLVFRRRSANTLAGIFANLPHAMPTSVFFQRYHLKHHAFQGVYELDADIPSLWEARLIGTSPWRKAIWLVLFPIFQSVRPTRLREIKPIDGWVVLNLVAQITFDVAVWVWIGPGALFYLLASLFFGVGLHPLGARWIQEHYVFFSGQETNSYYGKLNKVALNVGYHNEHHDFPSVPWNRLPRISEAAPEAYESLQSHPSWAGLLWRFLVDRRISLYSRQVRENRGSVSLNSQATPDGELLEAAPNSGPPSASARNGVAVGKSGLRYHF